jgi:preprotein translocase subunit SecY
MEFKEILKNLPEVKGPSEKRLSFNVKLKWTLIILIGFFVMSNIAVYGADSSALARFEYLAIIMGTSFGSIITLGIGPIVMASIVLQLLVGSKILDIDTATSEGKKFFQGLQKLLVFFFIIFEALVYVLMGGVQPSSSLNYGLFIVTLQLILGGVAILFMDELCNKWGFGSGVSLFIAAGVGWRLITAAFGFLDPQGGIKATGKILAFIVSLTNADSQGAVLALLPILITVILFLIVVWAQSLKIEVPLSYDKLRGHSFKWPLQFFYTNVIPVILAAALIANLQLFGGLIYNTSVPCIDADNTTVCTTGGNIAAHLIFLGKFDSNGQPVSGFLYWVHSTQILNSLIEGSWRWALLLQTLGHIVFFMFFTAMFSLFWVKTSGMDASSQAHNILKSGLQIPGFRKDERILESILSRYITPLAIMGGLSIGLLAATADVLGALVGGTSLLLGAMIIFHFYQNIANQHAIDMNPGLKKFMNA